MTRPTPRKSSLAGSTPVAPAAPAQAPEQKPAPASDTKAKKPKYPPKVSFYQDPEDTARVRGAILHTQVSEGSRSLSDFINRAVMTEVDRLEAKYNNGKPFPPIEARKLPQGRPMGQ